MVSGHGLDSMISQESIRGSFDPSLEWDVALGSSSGASATPGCELSHWLRPRWLLLSPALSREAVIVPLGTALEWHCTFLSAELSSSCASSNPWGSLALIPHPGVTVLAWSCSPAPCSASQVPQTPGRAPLPQRLCWECLRDGSHQVLGRPGLSPPEQLQVVLAGQVLQERLPGVAVGLPVLLEQQRTGVWLLSCSFSSWECCGMTGKAKFHLRGNERIKFLLLPCISPSAPCSAPSSSSS